MEMIRTITCVSWLTGLFDANQRDDEHNYIQLPPSTTLYFNRQPEYFQFDDKAVNVFAIWNNKREHVGHIATHRSRPPDQMHGHLIMALMDGHLAHLPPNLKDLMSFEGECEEKSNHSVGGSKILIHVSFSAEVTPETISQVFDYLAATGMVCTML